MNRKMLADLILKKLDEKAAELKSQYGNSKQKIGYFVIDNLLPIEIAREIHTAFPAPEQMKLRRSLREFKYIAAQMNQYHPLLEEAIYAFQDRRVVDAVGRICGIGSLHADEHLYAGGISLMGRNQFLNPHLDNSHDKDRNRWRALNLLYYGTPDWKPEFGGNLEIWPDGVGSDPITIESLFNRLAVMATHETSWHSVSPIRTESQRTCVSNYYFSDDPPKPGAAFHVTSFRGRPEQRMRDFVLRADIAVRQGIRKLFPAGAVKSDHLYRRPENGQ